MSHDAISADKLARYYTLNRKKKEIEQEINQLKKDFHAYFDKEVGTNNKGELVDGGYKLQRQIRKSEKFNEETTVSRLEEMKMNDLIQVVRKPDSEKINSAVKLGLLREEDLEGCRMTSYSAAISVKEV
ncbi:hypothetical protein KFZ58_15845 [Virgibacillus sp. NKC19-16]|uniref:hypothetical protein n=1 Tax=Virgibacillus salidurans TaxID=2831673 RepID=UPI001F42378E|nr:hypothetical protein [Virgibacillus sp. NKC19-16]UJL45836.1 hypothetical protein KFZ58_15845 [Virgibacillus sp. NKC19-16]